MFGVGASLVEYVERELARCPEGVLI